MRGMAELNDDIIIAPSDWGTSNQIIKVLGVGGGGCNAVNYMYEQHIEGCSFAVGNTDSQALGRSPVPVKIQLGRGLGAGTNPIEGRNAALESQDTIEKLVMNTGTQMLFITAGMGGGTGTGASPVIAKMAKEKGILTVAVVTIPFKNEGNRAISRAIDGIHELEKNVDALLIINNEKLHEHFGNTLAHDAFPMANEVLATAVRGIVEIIKKPGFINVDFKDVNTMMRDSGMALMGYGSGKGKDRIDIALKQAFESPLLNDFDLKSAKNVLINITGGKNEQGLTMDDINTINKKIEDYTGKANTFKIGLIWDESPEFGDTLTITAIVTGLRFTDILGASRDMGNYIMIDKNYVFDKQEVAKGEGLSLYGSESSNIGFSSTSNVPIFSYSEDFPPVLSVRPGEDWSELSITPAIRRKK